MGERLTEILNLFIGLRKTMCWIALMIVAVIFRLKGYVDGNQFVDLAKNTFLGFVAGNMAEHISTTIKEVIGSKGEKIKEIATSIDDEK